MEENRNQKYPSISFILGLLISISFGFLYECSVSDLQDSHHGHHHGKANDFMHKTDVQELAKRFDDPARDLWQKPEFVLAEMENLIRDKKIKNPVIWEIGAGSGYFSTKFLNKGWVTIAADPNPDFLSILETKKESLPDSQKKKFFIHKIPYDTPAIHRSDVSIVFLSNTYHHIDNRLDYFREVKKALRSKGTLVIVDYEKGKKGMGPPDSMRFSSDEVIEELKKTGFTEFLSNSLALPYQFLLIAK
jgi:SAM-dependent methyltransferase